MYIANFMKFLTLKCYFKNVTTLNSKFIEARNAKEKRNLLNNFDTRYRINLSKYIFPFFCIKLTIWSHKTYGIRLCYTFL
jgi:uncharacterized membrane protein